MENNITLSNKIVGKGQPCYLIAEVSQNHDGSLGMAHSYIDAVADTGFDAIKFQTHIASAESTLDEEFRINFSYEDRTRYDYWKRMEFTPEQWAGLKKHADDRNVFFISSVFSMESVELLTKIGVEAWKIGSGEFTNHSLLLELAKTRHPILLSTGMSDWNEINETIKILQHGGGGLALFQCTSKYPVGYDSVGINILSEMLEQYLFPIGLSDHSGTSYPSLMAMARGANMLEVHVTFHKKMFGPDISSSLTLEDLADIRQARDAFFVMDSNPVQKNEMASELNGMRDLFTKSLTLKVNQPAGTVLASDMLTVKKPGTGILIKDKYLCIGKKLVSDTPADRLLMWEDFS